jgi:hypothetical protein
VCARSTGRTHGSAPTGGWEGGLGGVGRRSPAFSPQRPQGGPPLPRVFPPKTPEVVIYLVLGWTAPGAMSPVPGAARTAPAPPAAFPLTIIALPNPLADVLCNCPKIFILLNISLQREMAFAMPVQEAHPGGRPSGVSPELRIAQKPGWVKADTPFVEENPSLP